MISLSKIASSALVALTLTTAAISSTTSAEAGGGKFWGGFGAGLVGGLVVSSLAQPHYGYAPSYGYAPTYYAPVCHREWRTDYYGNTYKVRVCN